MTPHGLINRLRWLLPFAAALATLFSSPYASASMTFAISGSDGATSYVIPADGGLHTYGVIIYGMIQDTDGQGANSGGLTDPYDGINSYQVGISLSGGLLSSSGTAYFSHNLSAGSVTWASFTISHGTPALSGTVQSGTIGLGTSSSTTTSLSSGTAISATNSNTWTPANGNLSTNYGPSYPWGPSWSTDQATYATLAAYPNYTAIPLAKFTITIRGQSAGQHATMNLIEGSYGATTVSGVDQWQEGESNIGGPFSYQQNGNGSVTAENGAIFSGTLNAPLDSITFGTTGTATYLLPASLNLREIQGSSTLAGSITITNGGSGLSTFTLVNSGANALDFGTLSGTVSAGFSVSSSLGWASTTTTGSQSGIIALTGLAPGDDGYLYGSQTASVTGAVVAPRTVTASPITLGRFIWNDLSMPSVLSTSGDDEHYTRVMVNGTLFNSATTTSTYELSARHQCAGPGKRIGHPSGHYRGKRRFGPARRGELCRRYRQL